MQGLGEDKKHGWETKNVAIASMVVEINQQRVDRVKLMMIQDMSTDSLALC